METYKKKLDSQEVVRDEIINILNRWREGREYETLDELNDIYQENPSPLIKRVKDEFQDIVFGLMSRSIMNAMNKNRKDNKLDEQSCAKFANSIMHVPAHCFTNILGSINGDTNNLKKDIQKNLFVIYGEMYALIGIIEKTFVRAVMSYKRIGRNDLATQVSEFDASKGDEIPIYRDMNTAKEKLVLVLEDIYQLAEKLVLSEEDIQSRVELLKSSL